MQNFHVITNAKTGEVTQVPFTQEETDVYILAHSPLVPSSITMRQARLMLLGAGLLPSVDSMIATFPEPNQSIAKIEWEFASEILRTSTLVGALGSSLGLTEAQLDDLFIQASAL